MPRRTADRAGGRGDREGPDSDPAWIARIREKLLAWNEPATRPLPWRGDRDPYRVLVSEMMLVQTTVAAVVPYFERFVRLFPDVASLARADEAEVLKAWEGLGYYRRARQLQAAARAVVETHGGSFPDDPGAILALPGVGRYIAGAVASFAFDRPEPIVEANTQRVLARWLAIRGDLKTSAVQARLWEASARIVPPESPGRFNQAFMDLGALVCTPRSPRCLACPVAPECRARAEGLQDVIPVATPKPPPLESAEACALVRRGEEVLVVRRGPGRLWDGFWEFPTIHLSGADPAGRAFGGEEAIPLAEGVRRLTGVEVEVAEGPSVFSIPYSVTRHRVRLDVYEASPTARGVQADPTPGPGLAEAAWVAHPRLSALTFSAASRRLLGRIGPGDGGRG